ncbi:hypothetical protein GW835_02840 [archaeon]|nr:hypothetical protein [archaeon]NCP79478.1 hypothetical protein [archaeon]NCP97421.1 hypothetical protein [archaeon]NCQ07245.1 hypothetical protein [archaeon]NCQ51041.1 hypothetical protein [archaeon]
MFIDRIKIQRKEKTFFEKNVDKKRKAISPLIATILLVVVAVAIIGIVLSWGKGFTNTTLSSADNVNTKNSFTGLIWSFETFGNNVLVENKSKQDLNITGYTINSLDHNGFWINSYHPLETTLSISPGTSDNVSLICMPEGKFILTLKTSTNENIPLNISPSKTSRGSTCEEYNVSLWEFVAETGSYSINTFTMQEGELVTNGGFETDLSGWLRTSHIIQNNDVADVNLIGSDYILEQQNVVEMGKSYLVTFEIKNYYSGAVYFYNVNLPGVGSGYTATSNGVYALTFTSSGNNILFRTVTNFVGSIDNISIVEIPPLETITTGTKYLENTTAGTTAIENKQAYGTWEFDVYKENANYHYTYFINSTTNTMDNSYRITLKNFNALDLRKQGDSTLTLLLTSDNYIQDNTWYRIKVARLQSEGVFNDIPTLQTSDMVNSATQPYQSFTSKGRYGFSAIANGTTITHANTADEIDLVNTGKYLVEFDLKLNSGIAPDVALAASVTSGLYSNSVQSIVGRNSFILTASNSITGILRFYNSSTESADYEVSNLTIRRIYPKDTFAVFIKGGEFGDDWTLVDTTGGSGTNPVTDSTYTTSNYFVADLDAGDRIANVKIKPNIE